MNKNDLTVLGYAQVMVDNYTREVFIDANTLVREWPSGNAEVVLGEGEQDGTFELGDDFEEEEFEGEDFAGEDDPEMGRSSRQDKKVVKKGAKKRSETSVVSGSESHTSGGTFTLTLRPQGEFVIDDVTFGGSAATAVIHSIYCGRKQICESSGGIPISLFGVGSIISGVVKGHRVRAGLDLKVNYSLQEAGTIVTEFGGRHV